MDSLEITYQTIVEKVLHEYAEYLRQDSNVQIELVFDRPHDHYLLVETGWQNSDRVYGTLLHIDIIDHKLWIQHDGTEDGIVNDLVAAGVPKQSIVLAFRSIERRKLTEFAVS